MVGLAPDTQRCCLVSKLFEARKRLFKNLMAELLLLEVEDVYDTESLPDLPMSDGSGGDGL